MFSVASLLALLALSVTGSPVEVRNSPITLPMTRRPAFFNVTDLLRHDEALVAALTEYSTHGRRAKNFPLTDFHGGYAVSIGIGNPATTYHLIVDSLYGITWVGASTRYMSSTGINTGMSMRFDYGYGSVQGTLFEDSMTFGTDDPLLSINHMQFGVASTSEGFGFDGVLGIGPGAFTGGIPTVTDYLFKQKFIQRRVVSIFFQPAGAGAVQDGDGEISFGGVNQHRTAGYIGYTEITANSRSSQYWGINQRITYGDSTVILGDTAGVVNCGCTFLYIASDAFERYKTATGGIENAATGLLQISPDQHEVYAFIPNAQIWPRSLNHMLDGGGSKDDIFLIVQGLADPTGSGFDFINGYVFLQRFHAVFDSGKKRRVGFARTLFTYSTDN
ncbi:aspartic peptidase domain-containing protein [Suillus spraguei]|nr:aspartic peptidase domain-containing protein [Suillus spraguei]